MTTGRGYRLLAMSALISAGLVGAWLSGAGAFRDTFREGAFDMLLPWLANSPEKPASIVVDIDRETLERYGSWPWPRQLLAELVDAVSRAKPAAIGLDVLLDTMEKPTPGSISDRSPEPSDRTGVTGEERLSGDAAIAEAASLVPTVFGFVLDEVDPRGALPNTPVLLRGRPWLPEIWTAKSVIGPSPTIAAVAKGFGAVVLLPDPDGRIRRVPLLVNAGGLLRPGLAVELLRAFSGHPASWSRRLRRRCELARLRCRSIPMRSFVSCPPEWPFGTAGPSRLQP